MDREPVAEGPSVLVVAGMHRSGTSLTAALVAAAGIHLGDELLPPSESNPRGHFEDLEFYRLHQKILAANGLSPEGYTCQDVIEVPSAARTEAEALVQRRRAAGRPWGWKDPRTVLFLDFWAELVPEARWLFVVRPPEEVVDSLFRRGDTAFAYNPQLAVDVCAAYGRRMLEFARRKPGQADVVALATVVTDPTSVVRRMARLLGAELAIPEPIYEAPLLTTGQAAHRATILRAARPEVAETFAELDRLAGHDPASFGPPPLTEVARSGLEEWAAAARLRADVGRLEFGRVDCDEVRGARDADRARLAMAERRLEAVVADGKDETIAALAAERDGLIAQLEAERAIQEVLRADMTARLEAALVDTAREPIG